jgi:hypothetical protein
MSPDFLKQLQGIIETALLGLVTVAVPLLAAIVIAYIRKLAQKLHTDAAVAAVEQMAAAGAKETGNPPMAGDDKFAMVGNMLKAAGVKADPTLIEAAVHGLKNPAP